MVENPRIDWFVFLFWIVRKKKRRDLISKHTRRDETNERSTEWRCRLKKTLPSALQGWCYGRRKEQYCADWQGLWIPE